MVIHQTGIAHASSVHASYAALGVEADIRPFIEDMAVALSQCDAIVCRAGAITVSELCAGGVASILIPLVISTTSHQRDNAQWMAQRQAAIHMPQTDFNPQSLAELLTSLTREKLLTTAQNAKKLGKPDAARVVADLVEGVLPSRVKRSTT